MNDNIKDDWKQLLKEVKEWNDFPVDTDTGKHVSLNDFIEDISKRYLLIIPYDQKKIEL